MKAVGKSILIQKAKEGITKTGGGLLLGENQKEDIRYTQATVISVGTEVQGIKEGDEIYLDRHAGHKIPEINGEIYHIIKVLDVVVVL